MQHDCIQFLTDLERADAIQIGGKWVCWIDMYDYGGALMSEEINSQSLSYMDSGSLPGRNPPEI